MKEKLKEIRESNFKPEYIYSEYYSDKLKSIQSQTVELVLNEIKNSVIFKGGNTPREKLELLFELLNAIRTELQ